MTYVNILEIRSRRSSITTRINADAEKVKVKLLPLVQWKLRMFVDNYIVWSDHRRIYQKWFRRFVCSTRPRVICPSGLFFGLHRSDLHVKINFVNNLIWVRIPYISLIASRSPNYLSTKVDCWKCLTCIMYSRTNILLIRYLTNKAVCANGRLVLIPNFPFLLQISTACSIRLIQCTNIFYLVCQPGLVPYRIKHPVLTFVRLKNTFGNYVNYLSYNGWLVIEDHHQSELWQLITQWLIELVIAEIEMI